jgi:hypothetical protein
MPVDLAVANAIPENCFRVGLIDAQLSRDSDCLPIWPAHCLAPHPDCFAIWPIPAKQREKLKTTHPTRPLIPFTAALSGNTVCASTVSARPR